MLKNLVGVVTGGASGLGKAAAKLLVEEGCHVTICDLADSEGRNVAVELGKMASFSPTNICNSEEVESMYNNVMNVHKRLDFLVNCAGISCAHKVYNANSNKVHNIQTARRVIETNLLGTFNMIRLSLKHMNANPPDEDGLRGVIVNIAGTEAFDGQIGQSVISGTSGALVSMTVPLARDLSDLGIRVVCVCPGVFKTPLTESMPEKVAFHIAKSCTAPKRLGKPQEFASAVKFAIENRYLNGCVLKMDAGLRLYLG